MFRHEIKHYDLGIDLNKVYTEEEKKEIWSEAKKRQITPELEAEIEKRIADGRIYSYYDENGERRTGD